MKHTAMVIVSRGQINIATFNHIKNEIAMSLFDQLQHLATERNTPCVSISFNTHRTHPDNTGDEVMLKNLLKEAEERVTAEYGKRPVASLLEKIQNVSADIDVKYNLDSLDIFLSNDTQEIVRSAWSTNNEGVFISESFAVRSLIKTFNRSESYLLMVISQTGVQLYEALNDVIVQEIKNDDFPFTENLSTLGDRASDAKHSDDEVREFLNKVDKALVKVHQENNLNCVVICSEENYNRLKQVANKPSVYMGSAAVEQNNSTADQMVKQSVVVVEEMQRERRSKAIEEMKEAVAHGKVLTDIQEIYQASIDGRADLLIVHQDFSQAVVMKDERTFDTIEDPTQPNVIDDITSTIAWEVLSKKGRVFFTSQDEIKDLGEIVLKVRY